MSTRGIRTRLVAGGLTVLLVAGATTACDSGASSPPTPSTAPTSSGPPVPTTFPTSSVSPADAPTHCVDPVGDGSSSAGGGDLTSVDLTIGTDAVQVTWRTTLDIATVAATRSVMFLDVDLTQPGGIDQPGVSVIVRSTDGVFETPFAQRVDREYVDATAPVAVDGTSLTATFPADILHDLGPAWTFASTLTQGTDIVDECRG